MRSQRGRGRRAPARCRRRGGPRSSGAQVVRVVGVAAVRVVGQQVVLAEPRPVEDGDAGRRAGAEPLGVLAGVGERGRGHGPAGGRRGEQRLVQRGGRRRRPGTVRRRGDRCAADRGGPGRRRHVVGAGPAAAGVVRVGAGRPVRGRRAAVVRVRRPPAAAGPLGRPARAVDRPPPTVRGPPVPGPAAARLSGGPSERRPGSGRPGSPEDAGPGQPPPDSPGDAAPVRRRRALRGVVGTRGTRPVCADRRPRSPGRRAGRRTSPRCRHRPPRRAPARGGDRCAGRPGRRRPASPPLPGTSPACRLADRGSPVRSLPADPPRCAARP